MVMILQPFPSSQLFFFSAYSRFCICNLNFSLQDLPLTSMNPTHLDRSKVALRLASPDPWQGVGTAKTTDAVLLLSAHKVSAAMVRTAQLRGISVCSNR